MPHAIITTTSRSAESRPNATRMPMSSAIGMVSARADGSSVTISRRSIGQGTPLAIICSASSMMNGMIRMKVKTSMAITNGGRISLITYRSSVFMPVPAIIARLRR
jgi:hypothetical protein